ncbi:MAG: hypothetical protein IJ327_01980 [Lachnospiraceae bacterium]|nr:hypothetical protein [Lachnospiraceae bacterium]
MARDEAGAVKGKYKTIFDEEFFDLLRESITQDDEVIWAAYAEIARKAVYSTEKVSEEEARLCYNIYRMLGER